MKRKFIALIGLFFLLTGYTYPDDAPYIIVNCALGNGIKIVFPVDQIEFLEVEGNEIINTRGSNIYGYYGANTRITFPTYDEPYYNNSYNSVSLSISSILENHLYSAGTYLKVNWQYYTVTLLGGLFICLFMIRR